MAGARRASTAGVAAPRKLHLGDGKLGAASTQGTVWETLGNPVHAGGAPLDESQIAELYKLFAVAEKGGTQRDADAPAANRRGSLASAKVQLLDAKSAHLKAISVHALAGSMLSGSMSSSTLAASGAPLVSPRAAESAELAGAMRIVAALEVGDVSAFTHDALVTLADLLPSEEDVKLVTAYEGPRESLGMIEQFTLAVGRVPFYRERAAAMLTRAGFTDRVDVITGTLAKVEGALGAVRHACESGWLGILMARALRLVQFLNGDDVTTRGFRLHALSRLEGYVSADKNTNLVHYLARSMDEGAVQELGTLEASLSGVTRLVWADVGSEVERTREAVEELRVMVERIRAENAADSLEGGGLGAFLRGTEAFCAGDAQRAVESLRGKHHEVDGQTRALLRWLAVEERAWARPEESFTMIYEFVLAIRQAQRLAAAAAERRERLSRWREAAAAATSSTQANLVDGVAERFESKTGGEKPPLQGSNERSAELLRLLMRRASIAGAPGFNMSDGESESESEGDDGEFD